MASDRHAGAGWCPGHPTPAPFPGGTGQLLHPVGIVRERQEAEKLFQSPEPGTPCPTPSGLQ